jgi:hypothetical protein
MANLNQWTSGEGKTPTQLDPLERTNFNDWTINSEHYAPTSEPTGIYSAAVKVPLRSPNAKCLLFWSMKYSAKRRLWAVNACPHYTVTNGRAQFPSGWTETHVNHLLYERGFLTTPSDCDALRTAWEAAARPEIPIVWSEQIVLT